MKVSPQNRSRLLLAEEDAVDEAMKEAVRHALLTHKRAGKPIASWQDGKVVIIPAEKIRVPGLNRGENWTSDDFDEPLPDEFWTGTE